ncbi:MAG: 30S ribosomal protein S12 methylthiotransferase RimO [Myxococcota bacterium]
MKRVHIVSLGCPKNRVDSELMIGQLQAEGYTVSPTPEGADVLVVNTCAFIDSAKEESIDAILEMAQYKAAGAAERLIVTGCMAQRYGQELERSMPEVDTFLGTHEFGRIGAAIRDELPDRAYIREGSYLYNAQDTRTNTVRGGTAYVKVSEGCNRSCAFCIIPKIRGRQVSRPVGDVITEVERLGTQGVREVVLVAQDMTSYGVDYGDRRALVKLLQGLNEVQTVDWVRLMYMYPWNFTDELLETIVHSDRILPYIDMPLQHIAAPILKRMRRNIKREAQRDLIARLRQVPGSVLRTTFIVGFPGETDADFQALCDWVEEVEFDRVGVFTYSKEEGTAAAQMEDQVEPHVMEERRDHLMALQQPISERKNRALIGQRLQVLVDGVSDEHEYVYEGRYYGQAPDIDGVVYLSYDEGAALARPGSMVEVVIEDASAYDLVGWVVPDAPLVLTGNELILNLPHLD